MLGFLCILHSGSQELSETVSIENIVSQNHGTGIVTNKLFSQQEGLCQPIWARLHL